MTKFVEKETIKDLARGQWLSVFSQLAPASFTEAISKKNKHVACPMHGGKDGFRFHDDVEDTGGAVCNTCGNFTDGIAFLGWANSWGVHPTLQKLEQHLGTSNPSLLPKKRGKENPSPAPVQATQQKAEPIKVQPPKKNEILINRLLKEAQNKPNQSVTTYLKKRGLEDVLAKLPSCLKSHDALGYYANNKKMLESPALIGEITKDGKRVGLQRHYLTGEGHKLEIYDETEGKQLPSKSMIGSYKGALSGGAVKFAGATDVLHVGEGIETMLAVWHSVGEPTWACCTAPLLRVLEVPSSVTKVVIWEDKDKGNTGHKAALALGDKLRKQGIETFYATPVIDIPQGQKSVDWLDVYREQGKEGIQHALADVLDPTNAIDEIDLYPEAAIARAVDNLNKTYTHVIHEGKNYVVRPGSNGLGQKKYEMFPIEEFVKSLSHEPPVLAGYKANGEPKYENPGKVWLANRNAAVAKYGMTFKPVPEKWVNVVGTKKLNMYFGLGVEPVKCTPNDIKPYLKLVRDYICVGNHTHFNYLMNWMAHMIQKPEEKPGVAVVMQGGQGTGKGSMVKPLGEIIDHHYFYAQTPKTVAGNFNAHLENKMMIFADEAFFADKASTNALKSMITESVQSIERKGVDLFMTSSYCRIIMASNHNNVVSAEEDERRYFVLQVSEDKKGNHEYWTEYNDWADSVPLAGMLLYYLQNRDISKYNPRMAPCTDALVEQKLHNAEPVMQFLFNALNNGCFVRNAPWPVRLLSTEIRDYFKEFLEREQIKFFAEPSMVLGKKLSKLDFTRDKNGGKSNNGYHLPSLEQARKKFEEILKGKIDWDT